MSRDGSTVVDPRSYDRYARIADAVASVDPAGAARLYATLKPRIEDAQRDLGSSDTFDHTLERAIVALLNTPVTRRIGSGSSRRAKGSATATPTSGSSR